MVVFLRTIIVSLISFLIVSSLAVPAASKELVGIVPFTNQRDQQGNNWVGFYFQSELQSYLAEGGDYGFHSLNSLRLWQSKASSEEPVGPKTTVLVTGSFQEVLEMGIVEVQLRRFGQKTETVQFELSYQTSHLETELPPFFEKIAKWIDPTFVVPSSYKVKSRQSGLIKEMFEFRELMYLPEKIPGVGLILRLSERLKGFGDSRFIADLAEGMIVLSKDLPMAEGKSLQQKAETLLRQASIKHVNNPRLTALLAEVYYISGKDLTWVRQTSEQTLKRDEFNEIALLMLLLSKGEDYKVHELKERLNQINPWIWPDMGSDKDPVRFQKGIFEMELIGINEIKE